MADLPSRIIRLELDVTDAEAVTATVAEAQRRAGPITALINNAAYGEPGPLELVDDERVHRQFDTNVYGPLRLIRAVLPQMRDQGHGTIINVSSAGAASGLPAIGLYCASKLALEGLSESLRSELRGLDIRVVVVAPGPIRTRFGQNAFLHADHDWVGAAVYWHRLQQVARLNRELDRRYGQQPSQAADRILRAVEARRPRFRYTVTGIGALMSLVFRFTPEEFRDWSRERLLHSLGTPRTTQRIRRNGHG